MLERMHDLPPGIDGLEATGKVSKEDYERAFEPLVDEARCAGRRIRFLYHLGPKFEGFTAGGAWEDAKLGFRAMQRFEGCAIVSDTSWIREASRLAGFLMPCPVRAFADREREDAVRWLQSLPRGAGVSHQLIPESEVIVVEVEAPLRAQDFDALAATADSWLETHRALRGLVIHARKFPGWENLDSLLRHVRFVRDHHKRVAKIALATDAKLADLAPRLGEHFVRAEIEHFGYEELDSAIAWASRPPKVSSSASTAHMQG